MLKATKVGAEMYFQPEADGMAWVAASLAGDDGSVQ